MTNGFLRRFPWMVLACLIGCRGPYPTDPIPVQPSEGPILIAEAAKLFGHTNSITSVAFSPDGKYVASGSYDRQVRVWGVGTWQNIHTIVLRDTIKAIEFSSDGRYLAISSFPGVDIIDTGTWQRVADLEFRSADGLAFSPDGQYLAVCGPWGLDVFRVRTWQRIVQLRRFYSDCRVHFSPDSRYLAYYPSPQIWAVGTWELVRTLGYDPSSGRYGVLAFSPDGRYLVAGRYTFQVWQVPSWQLVATLGHGVSACGAVFAGGGRYLLVGGREVWMWRTGNWELVEVIGQALCPLAVSRDGRYLASVSPEDGYVPTVWILFI